MCDTLEEGDTVYFYCGDGERSTRIARALIIIFLMCRFDHLLQFESLETVIRKHLTEQNYISLDFSNDFFHQPSQNNRGLVLENSIENCLHRFFNLFNPSPAYNEVINFVSVFFDSYIDFAILCRKNSCLCVELPCRQLKIAIITKE